MPILPTAIIFVALMSSTLWVWGNAHNRVDQDRKDIVKNNIDEATSKVNDRIKTYEEIMRGASGLFIASDNVTADEWKTYVETFNIKDRYSGVQGIGYAPIVSNDQASTFTQDVILQNPSFQIHPPSNKQYFVPVLYFEPSSPTTRYGYNLNSEPARASTMDEAVRTGTFTLTPLLESVIDPAKSQKSFIIYYPLFKKGLPTNTVGQRTEASNGFVFAPFRLDSLLSNISDGSQDQLGFRVYSSSDHSESNKLYETANFKSLNSNPGRQMNTTSLKLYNQTWTFDFVNTPNIGTPEVRQRPMTVLIAGVLVSCLISFSVYMLLAYRTKVMAYDEETKLQSAKDELLALASHQLRTPATGVKQYVGMLREGLAGDITHHQKQLLDKAYASNERQLATVSQMLSVARIDSGNLQFDKVDTNISKMLHDIVDEQRKSIKDKNQVLTTHIARKIHAKVDRQHLRMAIENLLNNASKYTPTGGKISVRLIDEGQTLSIIIRDQGVGISPEDVPLLFKKFVRIPNSLTKKVPGSGLGLYLAKNITEAHSGEIGFKSVKGEGTTFTITLPKTGE